MTRITRKSNFTAVPNEAMRDESISIEARGLLALMMGMGSSWVYRGKDLAKRCGVGREKYQRMIRELKDAGYLEVVPKQGGAGKLDGYDYVIHDTAGGLKNRPPVNPPAVESDHIRITTSKNTNLKTPQPPKGEHSFFSEMEEQEEQKQTSEKDSDRFDEFWSAYPKKVGKPSARKAWGKAIKRVDPDQIIAGAKAYASWLSSAKPGEFRPHVKHPQGWLNDDRWEAYAGAPEYSEDRLTANQRSQLQDGLVPPSMTEKGRPNAEARHWLRAYGYGEAAE